MHTDVCITSSLRKWCFLIIAPPIFPVKENDNCSARFFSCRRQGDLTLWCYTSPASRVAFLMTFYSGLSHSVHIVLRCLKQNEERPLCHTCHKTQDNGIGIFPPRSIYCTFISRPILRTGKPDLSSDSNWWCHWEALKELNSNTKSFGRILMSWMRDLFHIQKSMSWC